MKIVKERVYTGYRNTIELNISIEGQPAIDHRLISRCQLKLDDQLLDSAITPTYFDLTKADKLILTLGIANLPAKTYTAMLIIFDDTHAEGLVIANNLLITVI